MLFAICIMFGAALTLMVKEFLMVLDRDKPNIKHDKMPVKNGLFKKMLIISSIIEPHIQIDCPKLYKKYCFDLIQGSGLEDSFTYKLLLSVQIVSFVFFLILICIFLSLNLMSFVLSLVLGFLYPIFAVKKIKRKRLDSMTRDLPKSLDLIMLSVEAGLDFMSAVSWLVKKRKKTALNSEFTIMLNELSLGKSRIQVISALKERIPLTSIVSLCSMVVQAFKVGSPIGPVLKAHSDKLRNERFIKAERAGVLASQKVLIPLVFLIMPSVFVIIFGPLLVMYQQGYFNQMF